MENVAGASEGHGVENWITGLPEQDGVVVGHVEAANEVELHIVHHLVEAVGFMEA